MALQCLATPLQASTFAAATGRCQFFLQTAFCMLRHLMSLHWYQICLLFKSFWCSAWGLLISVNTVMVYNGRRLSFLSHRIRLFSLRWLTGCGCSEVQCGKLSGRFMCQSDNVQRDRQTQEGQTHMGGRGKEALQAAVFVRVYVCVEGEEGSWCWGKFVYPA